MSLVRRISILFTTLAAVGFFYAYADDVKRDEPRFVAQAKPTAKTSAPAAGSAPTRKDGKTRPNISITPEREAAAITFVQRNHAELAELLAVLKSSQPEEYERAIREIFRATERMNQIQERDPLQYELEVAVWTAQSRVQLLAAKLKMNESDELIKQLRDGLKAQNAAKISLLKHERQKVADRISKLDSDIARFESGQDSLIEQQLNLLTRAAENRPAKPLPKTLPKTNVKAKANTSENKTP